MLSDKISFDYAGQKCELIYNCFSIPKLSVEFRYNKTSFYIFAVTDENAIGGEKYLKVHFLNKEYAHGKIPRTKTRREILTDEETLISRTIDRSLRAGMGESDLRVDLTIMLIDYHSQDNIEIAALLGANLVMRTLIGPQYNLNLPIGITIKQNIAINMLDPTIIFCTNGKHIFMLEIDSRKGHDYPMLVRYIAYGQGLVEACIKNIENMLSSINLNLPKIVKREEELADLTNSIRDRMRTMSKNNLYYETFKHIYDSHNVELQDRYSDNEITKVWRKILAENYCTTQIRLDGRRMNELREIQYELNRFSTIHGSAVFRRGNTQVLTTITIAGSSMNTLETNNLYVHYNFHSFAANEPSRNNNNLKRREIGHGAIIESGLRAVVDDKIISKNILRVTVDVLSADGSTSMAGAMGTALVLRSLGLGSSLIIGLTIGCIQHNNSIVILTDLNRYEDELGIVDMKVLFLEDGTIIRVQLDTKIEFLTTEIFSSMLARAKIGFESYLQSIRSMYKEEYNRNIQSLLYRRLDSKKSENTLSIDRQYISRIIGKGGATIRSIQEKIGIPISINSDEGTIIFDSEDLDSIRAAKNEILRLIDTARERDRDKQKNNRR